MATRTTSKAAGPFAVTGLEGEIPGLCLKNLELTPLKTEKKIFCKGVLQEIIDSQVGVQLTGQAVVKDGATLMSSREFFSITNALFDAQYVKETAGTTKPGSAADKYMNGEWTLTQGADEEEDETTYNFTATRDPDFQPVGP